MPILSSIDRKTLLVSLVCDTVSNFGPEHHLIASHEIEHNVFKGWHERLLVDQVKIDLLIRGDLNSDVSFDVVDESSYLQHVVLYPSSLLCVLILLDFEEKNVG